MKEKMWAYLMHLSDNMWCDAEAIDPITPYCPELATDEDVWRQVIDYLPTQGFNTVVIDVGDAVQYESHPEIAIPGAWSKDKLKKELDRMRAMGLTPLPKLNFSAGHDAWLGVYSHMVSTPQYYEVCKDVITEVSELFGNPEYFHLGMDEEKVENQTHFGYICVRQGDLWWRDLYRLFDTCEKVGTRPWVWADFCWHEKEIYLKKMPKSVLQSNWWYDRIRKNPDGTYAKVQYDTYRILEEAGYDQVPCSSTCTGCDSNAMQTMQLGIDTIAPERLKGYMTAPWCNPKADCELRLMNDAKRFGTAKRTLYPNEK